MAKTIIARNPGKQPCYLNLPGGRSLKIPARGQAELGEEDLSSSEVALQLSRGNIVLAEEAAGEQGGEKEGEANQDQGGQRQAVTSPPEAAGAAAEEGGKE